MNELAWRATEAGFDPVFILLEGTAPGEDVESISYSPTSPAVVELHKYWPTSPFAELAPWQRATYRKGPGIRSLQKSGMPPGTRFIGSDPHIPLAEAFSLARAFHKSSCLRDGVTVALGIDGRIPERDEVAIRVAEETEAAYPDAALFIVRGLGHLDGAYPLAKSGVGALCTKTPKQIRQAIEALSLEVAAECDALAPLFRGAKSVQEVCGQMPPGFVAPLFKACREYKKQLKARAASAGM